MTVESEGIDDNPNWTCAVCEKASTEPAPTPIDLPQIMTPAPMRAPSNPTTPCPSCGTPMRLRKGDLSARFKCPSCQENLSYDASGNVQVFDEFKEFLKKRTTQVKARTLTPKAKRAAVIEKKEAEPETEEEAEHAPAGLIFAFVVFPLLAAFGLTFWPEAWSAVQGWLKPVLKTLGLLQ
jgi:hypothetical protein